jgi:hypothetical protein
VRGVDVRIKADEVVTKERWKKKKEDQEDEEFQQK